MLEYQNKERTIERKVVIVYWSKDKMKKWVQLDTYSRCL
jgi:hypothetical protein